MWRTHDIMSAKPKHQAKANPKSIQEGRGIVLKKPKVPTLLPPISLLMKVKIMKSFKKKLLNAMNAMWGPSPKSESRHANG